jgi:hypothetical protein
VKNDRASMLEFLRDRSGKARLDAASSEGRTKGVPKSRQGKVGILTYHAPEVAKQLKLLAAETGRTQGELVADGLNAVFGKYGKPSIAS